MADISKLLGSGVGGPEIQAEKENPIFGELSASLKNISEGITKLNDNIMSLVGIEAKEGKESRAETVERFKEQFETEKATGGGSDADILAQIRDNLQINFSKEFKVLKSIEENLTGGGGIDVDLPGGFPRGGSRGSSKGTKGGKNAMDMSKLSTTKSDKPSLLSRIGGGLKKAARFAGPLAAAGIGAVSAYQGSQRAGEFFGKDQEDATMGEKTAAGIGQIASDFTFGMVDPKEFAMKTKEFMDATNKFFMEDIPNFFTETLPAFFTEKFEELKETFPEAFKFISEDIPKFFTETIPEKLTEAKDLLVEKITAIKDAIVNTFVSIGNGIKEGIQGAIDFIMGIVEKVKNLPGAAVDKAKELADKGKEAVKGGIKKIGSFLGFGDDEEEEGVGRRIQRAALSQIDPSTGLPRRGGAIVGGDRKDMDLTRGEISHTLNTQAQLGMDRAAQLQYDYEQGGRPHLSTRADLERQRAQDLYAASEEFEKQGQMTDKLKGDTIVVNTTQGNQQAGMSRTTVATLKPNPRGDIISPIARAQLRDSTFMGEF